MSFLNRAKLMSSRRIEMRFSILRTAVAILISLAIAFLLIASVSKNPVDDFVTLLIGPLGNSSRMTTIISKMIPLLFTGTAICLVNSAGQINIAAEGSFFAGAVAATMVAILPGIPAIVHIPLCILAGAAAGAVIMGIPGIMHVRYNVVTIVASLMINYVALYLGMYIILNPLRDPTAGFEASYPFAESTKLPVLFGNSRIHIGLVLGVIAVIASFLLLYRTGFGLAARTIGNNSRFAVYSGMPVKRTIVGISLFAGCLAGIGGTVETLGNYQRFMYSGLTNHGWDGVMLAVLCHNKPQYMPLAALFLAYIRTSADALNFTSNVPPEIINVIQAVIIIFVAAEKFLAGWEHRAVVKSSRKSLNAQGGEG